MKLKIVSILIFSLVMQCVGICQSNDIVSTYKQLGAPEERSTLYTEKQRAHIGLSNPSINKFFNYEAGSVSFKTNMYDSDPFSKHDELGREYDVFFDYEAGNSLYNKPSYNTDYFVRTDYFGNKYDKYFDEETASVSYEKHFFKIGYFDQINELHQRSDKFFDYSNGVYQYGAEELADDNAIIYRSRFINEQVWNPKDDYIDKLTGKEFQDYIEKKYLTYMGLPFHLIYSDYEKPVLSQQNPDIDTGRERVKTDYFSRYDRYGNRYDKFFEIPEAALSDKAVYPYRQYNAGFYPAVPFFEFSYADEYKEIKITSAYPYRYSLRRSPYYLEFKQGAEPKEYFWNYDMNKFKYTFMKPLSF